MARFASPLSSVKATEDSDIMGVIGALEEICELESRLRHAIQQTHPLTTSLEWDFQAADRERAGLLAISQQLEYLEDKLRELRFVGAHDDEQKEVLLGQLDSVRRELLEVASNSTDKIIYAKELVKDVLAFASAGEESGNFASPRPPLYGNRQSPGAKTPKGKRTPSVPESLEQTPSVRYRATPDSSISGRGADLQSSQNMRSSRKYASISRSLMVSDEDIYGPKEIQNSQDSQKYGGTVKVKELLAKAEEGLSGVAAAQSERLRAPRVLNGEDTAMDDVEGSWMQRNIEYSSAKTSGESGDLSGFGPSLPIEPPVRQSKDTPSRYSMYDLSASKQNMTSKFDTFGDKKPNGVAVMISKIAGLTVALGSMAAAVVAVSVTLNAPKSKGKSRGRRKPKRSRYRGEADVPTLHTSDEEIVYFEDSESANDWDKASMPVQPPVMNVHKPPSSKSFPLNPPPDVTAAMG